MLLSLGDREQQMLSFTYFYFFFFFKFLNQAVKDSNDDKDPGGALFIPLRPLPSFPRRRERPPRPAVGVGVPQAPHPLATPLASPGGEENQNPTLGRTERREWLDSGPLRQI